MKCSLIFDQGKICIFVFSVDYEFNVKENLENFISNKCLYAPSLFWKKIHKRTCKFFQVKIIKIFFFVSVP